MDRRIYISERPLVCRQLPVWVHVPFAQEQDELLLGKVAVDEGDWNAVEGKIPSGKPGIFPSVGHRDDIGSIEVTPLRVSAMLSLFWWTGLRGVAVKPFFDGIVVVLLRPHETSERLP